MAGPVDKTRESGKPRVLVVTQDSSVLEPLEGALKTCGFESRSARSRSGAFTELARGSYQAVVLDADGFPGEWADVVAGIHKRHPDPLTSAEDYQIAARTQVIFSAYFPRISRKIPHHAG